MNDVFLFNYLILLKNELNTEHSLHEIYCN